MDRKGKAVVPAPSGAGPGSVEPASQPIKCGRRAIPARRDASLKPEPQTPVAETTRTSVVPGPVRSE